MEEPPRIGETVSPVQWGGGDHYSNFVFFWGGFWGSTPPCVYVVGLVIWGQHFCNAMWARCFSKLPGIEAEVLHGREATPVCSCRAFYESNRILGGSGSLAF